MEKPRKDGTAPLCRQGWWEALNGNSSRYSFTIRLFRAYTWNCSRYFLRKPRLNRDYLKITGGFPANRLWSREWQEITGENPVTSRYPTSEPANQSIQGAGGGLCRSSPYEKRRGYTHVQYILGLNKVAGRQKTVTFIGGTWVQVQV